MLSSALRAISAKKVNDIYLNIGHFLDHFVMLIFAKAAYDAGRHFGMSYDEIIVYGVAGFVLFGGMAPVAAQLADKFSRSLLMVIYHFGIGGACHSGGLHPERLAIGGGHRPDRHLRGNLSSCWHRDVDQKQQAHWLSSGDQWGVRQYGRGGGPFDCRHPANHGGLAAVFYFAGDFLPWLWRGFYHGAA